MTVGFMCWLQRRHDPGRRSHRRYDWERCNRAALCEEFTPFRGKLATATLQIEHQQIIIDQVLRRRQRAHALNQ